MARTAYLSFMKDARFHIVKCLIEIEGGLVTSLNRFRIGQKVLDMLYDTLLISVDLVYRFVSKFRNDRLGYGKGILLLSEGRQRAY